MREYNKEFKNFLEEIIAKKERPKLFLHACCGPCLAYPLTLLAPYFDLTIGFINPNIQPLEEYQKRLFNLEKLIDHYLTDQNLTARVVLINEPFDEYQKVFSDRKFDKEGGEVCLRCHGYRLAKAYQYADAHKFDYFTTVMTVSCKKPSRELNEIGEKLQAHYHTKFIFADFKKENGQLKGINIAKQYDIYRQNYCGCYVSLKEREEYISRRKSSLIG